MESRHDSENAERILRNINPAQLVSVIEQAYTKVCLKKITFFIRFLEKKIEDFLELDVYC